MPKKKYKKRIKRKASLPNMPTDKRNMNLIVIVALLLLVSVLFFKVMRVFLTPLLIAIAFTTLFYPFYQWVLKIFKGRKSLAATVVCLLLVLLLFVPMYFLGNLVVKQSIGFYKTLQAIVQANDSTLVEKITSSKAALWLKENNVDWQSSFKDGVSALGKAITTIVNKTSLGIIETLLSIFLTIFAMFYFFRDGEQFVKQIRYLSPLRNRYEERIMKRFAMISRATVKGTVVIGIIQGVIAAITLMIFGVKGWALWSVVILVLSIIPMVGAPIVMVPIGIVMIATGQVWQGIVVIFIGTVVNTGVDYLLRPGLVGKEAKLHDLLVLFSTIGGIAMFGIMGFVIGPVIAVLFVTLLDIYGEEFRPQLSG